jgi:SAM-dependent methyltransferase
MRIHHVATSLGRNCGVALFAQRLTAALRHVGAEVHLDSQLIPDPTADVVLVQHEWAIVARDSLTSLRRTCRAPVVVLPHTADGAELADCADAFITLNDRVLSPTPKPSLQIHHPSYVPARRADRAELKRELGLTRQPVVIGTGGFLLEHRHFAAAVARLLPAARAHGWLISVTAADHASTPDWMREELAAYAEAYPDHVRFTNRLLPDEELSRHWQACDLLWCWTALPDEASYASGVAADMYGSGTRLVIADKAQHAAVLGRPNVVKAPPDLDATMCLVEEQARAGNSTRHDPDPTGWTAAAQRIVEFLQPLLEVRHSVAEITSARPAPRPPVMKCGFLQNSAEIADADAFIEAAGWTHHADPVKDWDLAHVLPFIPSGSVLDLGSSGSYVLPNLARRGRCSRLVGIDLRPCPPSGAIEYLSGDLTNTGLAGESFDALTCLSVVEHGVDFAAFAREAARLLRPGGQLFVTFDYWEPVVSTGARPSWEILDRSRAESLLRCCTGAGFELVGEMDWRTDARPIHHLGRNYTFGLFTFSRR